MRILDRAEHAVHRLVSRNAWVHDGAVLGYQLAMSALPCRERPLAPHRCRILKGYFFGFHDKCPWSRDGSMLAVHANPASEGLAKAKCASIDIAVDAGRGPAVVSSTRTWNWQQGAMLQWVGDTHSVAFNDVRGRACVTRIIDVDSRRESVIPGHTAQFSPDGKRSVSYCFARLGRGLPGYGYAALRNGDDRAPRAGTAPLFLREHGETEAVRELVLPGWRSNDGGDPPEQRSATTFVSHTTFSRRGDHLALFQGLRSRKGLSLAMYVYAIRANRFSRVDLEEPSHYCWLADDSLLVTGIVDGRFGYFIVDREGVRIRTLEHPLLSWDGHPAADPTGRWIITDTYPDRHRLQRLILYDLVTREAVVLAALRIPLRYRRTARCDFHPRWCRTGRRIAFDSAHAGVRSLCLMDL